MTVTKVGGANMIAHAQWPLCPPFPRVAIFYVTTSLRSMFTVNEARCINQLETANKQRI